MIEKSELPRLRGAKLTLQTTKPIAGSWIVTRCQVRDCPNMMTYWSKTGKPKPEYIGAKCEKHS